MNINKIDVEPLKPIIDMLCKEVLGTSHSELVKEIDVLAEAIDSKNAELEGEFDVKHKGMTKMVFGSIEQRNGQLKKFAGLTYEIDKLNELVVWIKFI